MLVKTKDNLLWSGPIRLFMEGYLELGLTAILHVKAMTLKASFGSIMASDWLAWFALIMCYLAPIVLTVVVWRNRKDLKSKTF